MEKPIKSHEASKYIGCALQTLYKLVQKKEITYHRPSGKTLFFTKVDLDAYLLRNRVEAID